MVFKRDGAIVRTDSATPFDYAYTPGVIGTHTFVATPWSSTGGTGSSGASITVSVNVVAASPTPTPTPTPLQLRQHLQLRHTDLNASIERINLQWGTPFVNGTILISGRSYTITAQANARTQSVVFKRDGDIVSDRLCDSL